MQVQAERPLATLNAPHANKNRHNSFRRNAHGPWTPIMLFSKIDSAEATHVSVLCYTLESITEPYEDGQPRGPPAASRLQQTVVVPGNSTTQKLRVTLCESSCAELWWTASQVPVLLLPLRAGGARTSSSPPAATLAKTANHICHLGKPASGSRSTTNKFFYYLFLHVFIYYVFCFCTMHDQQYPQTAPCALINGVALTFFNLFLYLFLFFI